MDGLTYCEWRAKVESFRQKYLRAEKAYPKLRACWFRFSYPDRVSAEENCNHAAAFLQTIPNVVHAARFIAGSGARSRVYWCSLFGDVQDGVERFQILTDSTYRAILACPKPVRDNLNAVMPDWLLGADSRECGPGATSLFTTDRTANHMIWMTRMANLRRARPDPDLAIEHNTIYPGPTVPNQLTGLVERREYEPSGGGSIFNFPMELINEPQSIDTKKRTALATYAGPVVKCWSFVNSVWSVSIAGTEAILSAADKADSKENNTPEFPAMLPESQRIRDLCRKLEKDIPKGYSQITIARELTGEAEGDDNQAKSDLIQARRFKHLWHPDHLGPRK